MLVPHLLFMTQTGNGFDACFSLFCRLNAIHTLLESFGNSRTVMNANATRFTQIFSVDCDHSGLIVSASVQVTDQLEKTWQFYLIVAEIFTILLFDHSGLIVSASVQVPVTDTRKRLK